MVSTKTALLLLSVSLFAFASPALHVPNKDINGNPMGGVARREPQGQPLPPRRIPYCQRNAPIASLNVPSNSANTAFCSNYLGSSTTVTLSTTLTNTLTTEITTTATAIVTSVSTAPAPTATVTIGTRCRINGFGTPQYNAGSGPASSANFADCKALCLANAMCKSFGYGSGQCALYSVDAQTNSRPAATSYYFYDVTCPSEFAPATNPQKRADPATPTYFSPARTSTALISSACNCFISQPAPITGTSVSTSTVSVTATLTATTTATTTVVSTSTPATVTTTVSTGPTYG